jgi:4-cresol dehydrogenase (hydroxylating)
MRTAFANKHRIYPISGGKNWGNGSKAPCAPDCILMDLSSLNQITAFNEELAYVTIGPGVTQIQLFEFLNQRHSKLMPSFTGGSKHSSLVGNALERGDGFGAYGEHSKYVCNFEVVLPNGDLLKTGFDSRYQCAPLSNASLGPSLDGLFFQSNLGIITQMTLWLEPKPEFFHQVIFEANSLTEFSQQINMAQQFQLRNLTPYVSIWNDIKIRSRLRNSNFKCPKTDAQKKFKNATILRSNLDFSEKENLAIAYSKKSEPMPETPDLDRDGCGLMWCMALLPY